MAPEHTLTARAKLVMYLGGLAISDHDLIAVLQEFPDEVVAVRGTPVHAYTLSRVASEADDECELESISTHKKVFLAFSFLHLISSVGETGREAQLTFFQMCGNLLDKRTVASMSPQTHRHLARTLSNMGMISVPTAPLESDHFINGVITMAYSWILPYL